jgi:ABC-2 type transport system permease protein
MRALVAVMVREGRIRITNVTFIIWDLLFPIGYLLVFGVGVSHAFGFASPAMDVSYNAFFLAGVLGMASFGIASNTAWSFFLDRDNGIFYEMLTYPMSRSQYLLGKVLFNVLVAVLQAGLTIAVAALALGVRVRLDLAPALVVAVMVGTAGWFFFYAIFALRIRRNDAFNTITSVFYFVFLFASSMFYPLEPLPAAFRTVAYANPITWHVDVLRYTSIGFGDPVRVAFEAAAFLLFTLAVFAVAVRSLNRA